MEKVIRMLILAGFKSAGYSVGRRDLNPAKPDDPGRQVFTRGDLCVAVGPQGIIFYKDNPRPGVEANKAARIGNRPIVPVGRSFRNGETAAIEKYLQELDSNAVSGENG
jgi:hypothetical protein